MMKEESTFSPILNSNSRNMVGDREGQVHQRLLESGVSRDKKLKKKIKEEEKLLFSPMISHKSRELAEGLKNQMLVKLDNGQSQNLDFYYAIPNGASKASLYKQASGTIESPSKRMGAYDSY